MKKEFTILVADRNPHVRKFLKRELTSDGFRVRVAENATQVLKKAGHTGSIDLFIIDPDFFDGDQDAFINRLQIRIPESPVVIHGFRSDDESPRVASPGTVFIEKREDSIEHLKKIANEISQR